MEVIENENYKSVIFDEVEALLYSAELLALINKGVIVFGDDLIDWLNSVGEVEK